MLKGDPCRISLSNQCSERSRDLLLVGCGRSQRLADKAQLNDIDAKIDRTFRLQCSHLFRTCWSRQERTLNRDTFACVREAEFELAKSSTRTNEHTWRTFLFHEKDKRPSACSHNTWVNESRFQSRHCLIQNCTSTHSSQCDSIHLLRPTFSLSIQFKVHLLITAKLTSSHRMYKHAKGTKQITTLRFLCCRRNLIWKTQVLESLVLVFESIS